MSSSTYPSIDIITAELIQELGDKLKVYETFSTDVLPVQILFAQNLYLLLAKSASKSPNDTINAESITSLWETLFEGQAANHFTPFQMDLDQWSKSIDGWLRMSRSQPKRSGLITESEKNVATVEILSLMAQKTIQYLKDKDTTGRDQSIGVDETRSALNDGSDDCAGEKDASQDDDEEGGVLL